MKKWSTAASFLKTEKGKSMQLIYAYAFSINDDSTIKNKINITACHLLLRLLAYTHPSLNYS
jgi:hypothetical protein